MNIAQTILVLLLLLAPIAAHASAPAAATVDAAGETALQRRVLEGIDAMYAMRFDEARGIFDGVVAQHPDDPTGYYFRASIHLWKYLFDRSESDYRQFIVESDRMIEVAEEAIDNNPRNSLARAFIGAIYGYRAMANIQAENFLKASWDARSCYNHLSETLKNDPRQYEAYLGMGIFNFLVGALPETSRLLLNVAGISGDKDRGLQQLQIAAEKSLYTRNDARFTLGLLHVYYRGDYGTGIGYLKGLLKQYPNNIPLLYAMGNIESQLKKMNNAVAYYQKVIRLADDNFRQFTVYSNFRMGEAYFRLNDFANAKRAMQKFVKGNTDKAFRAIGLLRLAQSYEMLGDRDFAVQLYRRTTECLPVTTEDRYAVRKAEAYLATPMSDRDKQLIRGINHVESLNFEQGETMLRSLLMSSGVTATQQAEAYYHIGEAMRQMNRPADAVDAYRNVIRLNPDTERWLVPWAYFRMSQMYYAQQDTERSRAALDKAKVFTDYDFREWLVFQIERDLSTLY